MTRQSPSEKKPSSPHLRTRAMLEDAYLEYHSKQRRAKDPVDLVHTYRDPRDQEVVAFLAALVAYGNVAAIQGSVRKILSALSPSPYRALLKGSFPTELKSFCHRFTTGADLAVLMCWMTSALKSHGSLEGFFAAPSLQPMKHMLSDFIRRFTAQPLPDELKPVAVIRSRNLKYLLSDPERGSACKRLNMFLRWMVREDDGIDLGIWKTISPSQLMLPVDTHVLQTLRALRWTKSEQASWRVVESATARLKKFRPEDPIRYDFSLCHLSMAGEDIRRYPVKTARGKNAPLE